MTWTPTTPEEVAMVLVMPVPDGVRHRTASGTTMKDGGLSVASRRFRHRTVVKPQRKAGGGVGAAAFLSPYSTPARSDEMSRWLHSAPDETCAARENCEHDAVGPMLRSRRR